MPATSFPLPYLFSISVGVAILIIWIVLVAHVFQDLFRSPDLSGAAKALWVLVLFALPLLGSLVYLIARGGSTHDRQPHATQSQHQIFEDYIRAVSNTKE